MLKPYLLILATITLVLTNCMRGTPAKQGPLRPPPKQAALKVQKATRVVATQPMIIDRVATRITINNEVPLNNQCCWFLIYDRKTADYDANQLAHAITRLAYTSGVKNVLLHAPYWYDLARPWQVAPNLPLRSSVTELQRLVTRLHRFRIAVGGHLQVKALYPEQQDDDRHLGHIFKEAGFDWVYFDGYEYRWPDEADADWPIWARRNAEICKSRLLELLPTKLARIQSSASPLLSPMITSYGQTDPSWISTDLRTEIDYRVGVMLPKVRAAGPRYAPDLGWLSQWVPGTRIEKPMHHMEYEYVWAKAWENRATVTVQIKINAFLSDDQRARDTLAIVRKWEKLRTSGVTAALPTLPPGAWGWMLVPMTGEIIAVYECPFIGITKNRLMGFVGREASGNHIFTIWNVGEPCDIKLDARLRPAECRIYDVYGRNNYTLVDENTLHVRRRLYVRTPAHNRKIRIGLRYSRIQLND